MDSEDRYDYAGMETGNQRAAEGGTFRDWEDWFTERGMCILAGPALLRGIYDRLGERFFLGELERIWHYVQGQKLKDPKAFFVKVLERSADELEEIMRKVQRYEQLAKLRGQNMDPVSAERQLALRDEFICAHMLERRTIEWVMVKERMSRTEVLDVWDRKMRGISCPGVTREGPDDWEAVKDCPDSWRAHDETRKLRQRGEAIAREALARKEAARQSKGLEPDDRDPEELDLADVIPF